MRDQRQTKKRSNVVSAFTDEQAARLTGLSVAQLRNWDRTGFFVPSMAAENRRVAYSRIYSFSDLLSLQVLKRLRKDMGVPLQHLRKVKKKLAELADARWSSTTLYVLNKRVVFHDEEDDEFYEPVTSQRVFKIPLQVVRSDMRSSVETYWKRSPGSAGQITKRKTIAHNASVIAETRVPVRAVRDFLEAGYGVEEILAEYPTLTKEDVEAVRQNRDAA